MSELTPGWTMGDAEDARRRLLDVAERCGWQVKEDDPDNDWISLADAVARVEALEKEVAAWKLAATFDDWSGTTALRGEEER
jgi:hypothetical protein